MSHPWHTKLALYSRTPGFSVFLQYFNNFICKKKKNIKSFAEYDSISKLFSDFSCKIEERWEPLTTQIHLKLKWINSCLSTAHVSFNGSLFKVQILIQIMWLAEQKQRMTYLLIPKDWVNFISEKIYCLLNALFVFTCHCGYEISQIHPPLHIFNHICTVMDANFQ